MKSKGRINIATTVNFTGSVDHDLLKRVKVIAAKTDTSINALFNAELRYRVETLEASVAGNNQNYRTLLDFSLGRSDDITVMAQLGIISAEDLFLFEDHKIARASFLLPDKCRKVSTRAFLLFLEQKGWLASSAEIERRPIQAGRVFFQLRFPNEST